MIGIKSTVKNAKDVSRKWYQVDAQLDTLGRLATRIARVLSGKQHVDYTPHVDMGDFVVVLNAKNIRVTGKKLEQKTYHRYSGYPGGMRKTTLKDLIEKRPDFVIKEAVRRMMPKTKLRAAQMRRLKIVTDQTSVYPANYTIK